VAILALGRKVAYLIASQSMEMRAYQAPL